MTQEDRKYRQGRSKEQEQANTTAALVAASGLALIILFLTISNIIKHGI
jgi:hypothetical protein